MKRSLFIILLILPFVIAGLSVNIINGMQLKDLTEILKWLILVYIPILTIIRMRYIKLSWKQFFLSFVPIIGIRNRFKIFTEK